MTSNTLGRIANKIGVRKATIINFCKDFRLDYNIFNNKELPSNLVSLLLRNSQFLKKYEEDYYTDKTPLIISETIKRHINVIELYLKYNYPTYYLNGIFIPKEKYCLRYISSYRIDNELGGNYDFL